MRSLMACTELVPQAPESVSPFRLGCELLRVLRAEDPADFAWRQAPYEFVADRPAIDLLTGSIALRAAIDGSDRQALEDWFATWSADEAAFREERRDILLYPEAEG